MYKSTKVLLLLSVLLFSASSLFAQLSANANATVEINIKKALSITVDGGSLDYGDVIVGATGNQTKTPDQGVKFLVSGHNSGTVTLTYGNATLNDGGTNNLTFIPDVVSTAGNNTYTSPLAAASGSSQGMTDKGSGNGELYLWVGGSIDVSSAVQGDYSGTFTMTVAY